MWPCSSVAQSPRKPSPRSKVSRGASFRGVAPAPVEPATATTINVTAASRNALMTTQTLDPSCQEAVKVPGPGRRLWHRSLQLPDAEAALHEARVRVADVRVAPGLQRERDRLRAGRGDARDLPAHRSAEPEVVLRRAVADDEGVAAALQARDFRRALLEDDRLAGADGALELHGRGGCGADRGHEREPGGRDGE